jgi:hypothetical protein
MFFTETIYFFALITVKDNFAFANVFLINFLLNKRQIVDHDVGVPDLVD